MTGYCSDLNSLSLLKTSSGKNQARRPERAKYGENSPSASDADGISGM